MTSPFRSTLGVAARRRQRPAVERSTFVIATCGGHSVALPVEQVERVIRAPHWSDTVLHESRQLPVHRLSTLLGQQAPLTPSVEYRVVIVNAGRATGDRLAVATDAVREVFAIETALVVPVARVSRQHDEAPLPPFSHAALRGRFTWHQDTVWVVDAAHLEVP